MRYLLGIDIGGTKYHARAQLASGAKIDIRAVSRGNLHVLGAKEMTKELTGLVRGVQQKLRTRKAPDAICIGISGLDDAATQRALLRTLSTQSWWKAIDPNRRQVLNDISIGMRAGTPSPIGIAIIAGTGSAGYGLDPYGQEARVSGRGIWMAGQGSGYDIGLACLRAVRKAEDGRGPATTLEQAVYAQFRVRSTEELMPIIYAPAFGKRQLAELNVLVETQAEIGDRVAMAILDEAVEELLLMATTLHKRLSFGRAPVDVVLIGGVINKNKYVLRGFLRGARKQSWMRPIPLVEDPVAGALEICAEMTIL